VLRRSALPRPKRFLCVPKTSSDAGPEFGGSNSLFTPEGAVQTSLFRENNSLFCCVGNSHRKACYNAIIWGLWGSQSPDYAKFPVLFPVSREFGIGDRFDIDCIRHHPVSRISKDRSLRPKGRQLRGTVRLQVGLCSAANSTSAFFALASLGADVRSVPEADSCTATNYG
jgi:hypothetical protein